MKRFFIVLFSCFSLYSSPALDRIKEKLADIDTSLKMVKTEVETGYSSEKYLLEQLQVERAILLYFMQGLGTLMEGIYKKTQDDTKVEKLLSKKIERFLNNIKSGCVRECFETKLEEKRELLDKIDKELAPAIQEGESSSLRKVAIRLVKEIEDNIRALDDQIVIIVLRAADAKNPKKFKCLR